VFGKAQVKESLREILYWKHENKLICTSETCFYI